MANTVLQIKVEAGKDFFHFYDVTGQYDKKDNKSGWGSPNDKVSDVVSSSVRIFIPGATEFSGEVSMTGYLPNPDCVGFELIPADVNLETFPPGVYRFEYIVNLQNGLTLAQSCYVFFWQPLKCCIEKKKMKTDLNDASSDLAKKVIELETLLENAKWCACAGRMDCAQEISDYIWTNCGCCC